ncbi:MAG: hypothetical protein O3A36_03235 [bacterium]|nr:hypothetical protein [bacterium]
MENRNERALKIIEQQYASFINLTDKWDFFRGLAQYTKTVQEMTQTRPFIETLERQRALTHKVYEQMNSQAFQELTKSAQRMTEIAQKVMKDCAPAIKSAQLIAEKYQPIMRAMQELQDQMNGRILSSSPLYALDSDLFDVARRLKASGHEEEIKEFENNKKRNHNPQGNFTFSPVYEKLSDEETKVQRKEQVEPWGAWHQLPLVKKLVFEPEEMTAELKSEVAEDPTMKFAWLNYIGVAGEMEKIRKGDMADDTVVFFRVKDFKSYAQRVHTYITAELLKADTEGSKLEFDDTKRVLYFMNESILISKKEESDPHKLMRTLFKDEHKVWASDEVLEDWGYSFDESISTNKVYQAGKAINRIVAQDTKIKDFLEVSTKSISINKKYLKT